MRLLLKAVHGVVAGLSQLEDKNSLKQAEQAARAAGMGMAVDVNPALIAKLPLPFKQMGMSVHKDFDGLADAIAEGEVAQQLISRLASITSRCTTCHDLYRLSATKE
jgi:cytochrome c556